MLLIPCVSYILFEYVTGNLPAIPLFMAALNIGWIYLLYLAVFAVSGSTRIGIPLTAVFLYLVSVAEYLVAGFRGRPIMIWDVLALRTAMEEPEIIQRVFFVHIPRLYQCVIGQGAGFYLASLFNKIIKCCNRLRHHCVKQGFLSFVPLIQGTRGDSGSLADFL